nr:MAG TPA: hypothetical protein [Caudoviricetes sp.]
MKKNWPTAPVITVIKGNDLGEEVKNVAAIRRANGLYVGKDFTFSPNSSRDRIDQWDESAIIPMGKLNALREAWYGSGGENASWLRTVEDTMRDVLEAIPERVTPVTQAARKALQHPTPGVRVEDNLRAKVIALFRAVDAVNTYGNRVYALTKMVRLVSDWENMSDPEDDALVDIQDRAWDIYSPGHSGRRDVVMLARLVGQVVEAAASDENLRPTLLSLGSYALAWAAELIAEYHDYEEEDDE